MESVDLDIDVTHAVDLGEPLNIAITVHLPDPATLGRNPIVCFGKPGGGYGKGYYTEDLPGPANGAQAAWHAERGWIFVSVDHLGVGASTVPKDPVKLDYTRVAAASQAAEAEVLRRLNSGDLSPGFPAVADTVCIGIGQSMGGCMTIIQQGRYHCYDGIGVLGYGAIHTDPATAPGAPPLTFPWVPRDTYPTDGIVANGPAVAGAQMRAGVSSRGTLNEDEQSGPAMGWCFFYDDVDPALVQADLRDFPTRQGNVPPWASATLPTAVAAWCMAPGAVAPEAAAVQVPVLVAMGERDVIADPRGEPRAYLSARSVDLFVCPHMGHMHNFASTRELFWERIESWADWVRRAKRLG